MIKKYIEQLLDVYNYVDGIFFTDMTGKIEYYHDYRLDINDFTENEVLGKHILEVYPDLSEEESTILKVIKTGEPIFNQRQKLKTLNGKTIEVVSTTLPIKLKDKIIGIADVSKYMGSSKHDKSLKIEYKKNSSKENLFTINDIVAKSNNMKSLKNKILKVANTDSSVLIFGETGTGKELVAQALHYHSKRKDNTFMSQNCAAIPSALLESIFFGTVKGSYTGAENSTGIFELADKGTIFLDEINSMDINVQSKILKVIEEKRFKKVGGTKFINTDIRVISAINENPIKCIEEKTLRADLFYRLGVVQLNIPPLRERKDDIEVLIDYFVDKFNKKMNKNIIGVDDDVKRLFCKHLWHGNVRELKNIIEGAFNITSSKIIEKHDLPEYIFNNYQRKNDINKLDSYNDMELSLKEKLDLFEKSLIQDSIKNNRNLSETAKCLKISRQTLNYKINKYNL